MGVHYVDDLLLVAPDNILEETSKALEEKFTLATPERVTGEKTATFCGYEISKTDQGYTSTTSSTNTLEVTVDASFGPPHEGYRSAQGIMMSHGGNPIMWASTRNPSSPKVQQKQSVQ